MVKFNYLPSTMSSRSVPQFLNGSGLTHTYRELYLQTYVTNNLVRKHNLNKKNNTNCKKAVAKVTNERVVCDNNSSRKPISHLCFPKHIPL